MPMATLITIINQQPIVYLPFLALYELFERSANMFGQLMSSSLLRFLFVSHNFGDIFRNEILSQEPWRKLVYCDNT